MAERVEVRSEFSFFMNTSFERVEVRSEFSFFMNTGFARCCRACVMEYTPVLRGVVTSVQIEGIRDY